MLASVMLAMGVQAEQTIHIDFGGATTTKTGQAAALTVNTNPTWNAVGHATTVSSNYNSTPVITHMSVTNLVWDDNTSAGITMTVTNLTSSYTNGVDPDAMLDRYIWSDTILYSDYDNCCNYVEIEASPEIWFKDLPADTYDLYLYAPADYSSYEGFRYKTNGGSFSSWKETASSGGSGCCCMGCCMGCCGGGCCGGGCCGGGGGSSGYTEGEDYVVFTNIVVGASGSIAIELKGNDDYTHFINGIELVGKNGSSQTQLPDVSFSPGDGTETPATVTLSVSGHSGATIYYTTDGSTPTTSSSTYSSSLSVNSAQTIKAFATESGYSDSDVSSASYVLPTLPDVSFSPVSGGALPVTLTLSVTGHNDADIYYTTDGTSPTTNGTLYVSSITLATNDWSMSSDIIPNMTSWDSPSGNTVTNSTHISGGEGWKAFDSNAATYWEATSSSNSWLSFEFPSTRRVAKYSIAAASGDSDGPKAWTLEGWDGSQWVSLDSRSGIVNWGTSGETKEFVCSLSGHYSKYRINCSEGNVTTSNSSGMISIGEVEFYEAYVSVYAYAEKTSYNDSDVLIARYYAEQSMIPVEAASPLISPSAGDYDNEIDVSITAGTTGSTIYYSTNGTDWITYSGSITDSLHGEIQAYASATGYLDSSTATNLYTFTVADIAATPVAGTYTNSFDMTLTNATDQATIEYQLDGGSLTTYSGAVTITNTTTVTVISSKTGFTTTTNTIAYTFVPPFVTYPTLNVNLGAGDKEGESAVGYRTNDVWNLVEASSDNSYDLNWHDGSSAGVSVVITNLPSLTTNAHSDEMLFSRVSGDTHDGMGGDLDPSLIFSGLPDDKFDVYVYGIPGSPGYETYKYKVVTETETNGWTDINATSQTYDPVNSPLTEGWQYLVFSNVVVGSDGLLTVHASGDYGALLNGVQLVKAYDNTNRAPVINGLSDELIYLPNDLSLAASIVDDGRPAGGAVTSIWSVVYGPGPVTFSSETNASTTATFTYPGLYQLQLYASDTAKATTTSFEVEVLADPNTAPVVTTQDPATIDEGQSLLLEPVVTDGTGYIWLTKTWAKLAGPGTVSFTDANAATNSVSFGSPGTYFLELTVSDGSLEGSGVQQVTVSPTNTVVAPAVHFTSPNDQQSFETGSDVAVAINSSDTDGSVELVYLLLDGEYHTEFTNSPYSLTLEGLSPGSYVLNAVSVDDDGASTTSTNLSFQILPEFFLVDLGKGFATDINEAGQVVGHSDVGELAFIWQPDFPNGQSGMMTYLTNSMTGAFTNYGFASYQGLYEVFGTNGMHGHANSITDAGAIAGDMLSMMGAGSIYDGIHYPQQGHWEYIGTNWIGIDVAGLDWDGTNYIEKGEWWSTAFAINNSGVVAGTRYVGHYNDYEEGYARAYVRSSSGTPNPLVYPNGLFSSDIFSASLGTFFQYNPTAPNTNDMTYSAAYDINDNGWVVGFASGYDTNRLAAEMAPHYWEFYERAFLYGGTAGMIPLGTLEGGSATDSFRYSAAYGISAGNHVVGVSSGTDGYDHAFLWTPTTLGASTGTMSDLGKLLGDNSSLAFDVKMIGTNIFVVGSSWSSSFPSQNTSPKFSLGEEYETFGGRAFIYDQEEGMRDLNELTIISDWDQLTDAKAINKQRQIVGVGKKYDTNGMLQSHAFLLVPNTLNTNVTVTITSPTNETSLVLPESVTVEASVAATNVTVQRVEFYKGSTLLGVDTDAPYSVDWINPALGTHNLYARAVDSNDEAALSLKVELTIQLPDPVPTPVISPISGTYSNAITVGITSSLAGAELEYSFDGAIWAAYSTNFIVDGGIEVIYAKGNKEGWRESSIASNLYSFVVPETTFSPNGGNYTNAVSITASNSLPGVLLIYSLDEGRTWTEYTNSFDLDGIAEGSGAIRFWATKSGYQENNVETDLFRFKTSPPIYSHATGNYTNAISVTITSASTNATVEYSTEGTRWKTYSTAIPVHSTQTLYARVKQPGYEWSGHGYYSAIGGFSSVQGANNWFYKSSSAREGAITHQLSIFEQDYQHWRDSTYPVNLIGAGIQHAGMEYDSVRVFDVPVDGDVVVENSVRLSTFGSSTNLVKIRVTHNSTNAYSWATITNGQPKLEFDLNLSVTAGDQIGFQLTSGGGDNFGDLVFWQPRISYESSRTYTFTDTDGDGLSDTKENELGTSNSSGDTDGDGLSDYLEVLIGTDPTTAAESVDAADEFNFKILSPLAE